MREEHLRRVQSVLAEARFVYLHESHLPDRGGGLQLVHGVRAPCPAEALHALGNGAARYQHDFLTCPAQFGNLSRPAGDRGGVQPRAPVGHERAADFDDETLCFFHAEFPVSRNFITAKLSSRQPSPVSAEMQKLGPRQRNPRANLAATASRSAAGSISILFSTSQRGLRCKVGSNFFNSAAMARASRTGSAPSSTGAASTICKSSRVRARCLRNWCPSPAPLAAPSMSPGISATTKLRSTPTRATPRCGCNVVNG